MKSTNYTIHFYLRILFCISIVLIWSLWLLTRPEDKKHKTKLQTQNRITKKIAQRKKKKKNTTISYNAITPSEKEITVKAPMLEPTNKKQKPTEKPVEKKSNIEIVHKKQDTTEKPVEKKSNIEIVHKKQDTTEKPVEKKSNIEIVHKKQDTTEKPANKKNEATIVKQEQSNTPKPVVTTILTQPTPTNTSNSTQNPSPSPNKTPSHTNIDINLPTIATATRKALSNTAPNNSAVTLKNKPPGEQQNQKAFDLINDLNSNTSWLPKYPEEKD